MQLEDSIRSGQFTNVTPAQVDAARTLATIGWKWNRETIQKGVVRLVNKMENEFLPGRHKLGETIVIAEIRGDGYVAMGPACDGQNYARKRKQAVA